MFRVIVENRNKNVSKTYTHILSVNTNGGMIYNLVDENMNRYKIKLENGYAMHLLREVNWMDLREALKLILVDQPVIVRYERPSLIKKDSIVYDEVEGKRSDVWRDVLCPEKLKVTEINTLNNTILIVVDLIR